MNRRQFFGFMSALPVVGLWAKGVTTHEAMSQSDDATTGNSSADRNVITFFKPGTTEIIHIEKYSEI